MANLRADNLCGTGGRNAIDGSLFFNGDYDSLAIPSIALGSGDWTIEFWFYSTKEGSQDGHIYDGRGTGAAGSAYPIIKFDTDEKLSFYTTGAIRIQGASVVELGSWNHVALVKNSSTTTLYLNGQSEGTYSDSNTYLAPSNSIGRIGSDDNGSAYYFYGFLSNLRLIKGSALYTANFTRPTEKLTAVDGTVLLCCQDSDDATQEATGKTITGYGNLAAFSSGDNLITNGTFDSATTGWTSDGTIAIDSNRLKITNDAANYRSAYQDITVVAGKAYRVTADCIAGTSNNSNFHVGTTSSSNALASAVTSPVFVRPTVTTMRVTLNVGSNTPGHTALYDNVEVREVEPPKAPKVLPPVGVDEGVTFEGDIKVNSQGYMYFPTGTTEQRVNSRGRAVIPGGYNPSLSPVASRSLNTIEYLEINTTSNALDFGDLSFGSASGASCGSSTRGLIGGSYISPSVTGSLNNIDYITIASTGNGADFGDLTQGRSYLASFSSSTRGIWAGGVGSPTPSPYMSNTIDYVTIATAGNATDFGDSADVAYYGAQGASSPTRGIWSGGSPSEDMIQYVTIASTGNANEFGNLSADRKGPCEASSSTRCIIVGGYTPTVLNTMEYITIATTGNAKDFGDLAFGGAYIAGTSNSVRAVWTGRYTVPATHNTIQYSTIQTLGNAIDFGDLISAYTNLSGATSDSHGGLS